ncbi:hypothetical protein HP567_007910 [Brevibacillus sp. M2.1A]|uniref:hypothetical protein n=1 Tax=unclassified Brevibacillus TaxID=2684853 RepID=UPI00156B4DE6|nr:MULTISPECIES: hypothetical protein [unclassified Brevibacillus]MCC8434475.1 hypothetical protein [Brevibacillus sp. M2.1A]MCE0452658.1 hypothetical protein [Brevibacillus sp. AF8]
MRVANASVLTWSLYECAGQGLAVKPSAGLSAKPAWHISHLHLKTEATIPLRSMMVSAALPRFLPGLRNLCKNLFFKLNLNGS